MEEADKSPNMWTELLPPDLLFKISTCLHSPIDKTRLRSVCSAWRSSLPPPSPSSPNSRLSSFLRHDALLNLPWDVSLYLYCPYHSNPDQCIAIDEARVYFLQSTADPSHSGTVVTVQQSPNGNRLRAFHPLSLSPHYRSPDLPLDLSDFRVSQLAKFYYMNIHEHRNGFVGQVVVSVNDDVPASDPDDGALSLMLKYGHVLRYYKMGDERWSGGSGTDEGFEDVVYRNGNFYYALENGDVRVYNNKESVLNYEVVKPPPEFDSSFDTRVVGRKYLVEAEDGKLYILARNPKDGGAEEETTDDASSLFKVFCLDDSRKQWERVYDLGNLAFFATKFGSFSVAGHKFPTLHRNCVYFTLDGDEGFGSAVFQIQSGTWRCLSDNYYDDDEQESASSIFSWPPTFRTSSSADP